MTLQVQGLSATSGRRQRILIAGAGPAGWAAAGELRRLGFSGEVLVVGGEPVAPYDRTACSKGLLDGSSKPSETWLDVSDCPGVDWRLGRLVVDLAPAAKMVVTDTGDCYPYDGLVIATGARVALPTGWPRGEPGMHMLRDMADVQALRRDLRDARRVVVVGGGITGCEVAAAIRDMAREVIIVDSGPCLMARALGKPVGELVTAEIVCAGIGIRLQRRVLRVDRKSGSWRVRLDDGTDLWADLVVAAVGERPETSWLTNSGLDISDGVLCEHSMKVPGVRDIVVAGAVARWPNPAYGVAPQRIGQWVSAIEQGQAAARALVLPQIRRPPVSILPRFSSEQLGLRIQVCGYISGGDEAWLTELRPRRRDKARAGLVANYFHQGRLTGVVAVNAPRAFAVATRSLLAVPRNGMAPMAPVNRSSVVSRSSWPVAVG